MKLTVTFELECEDGRKRVVKVAAKDIETKYVQDGHIFGTFPPVEAGIRRAMRSALKKDEDWWNRLSDHWEATGK